MGWPLVRLPHLPRRPGACPECHGRASVPLIRAGATNERWLTEVGRGVRGRARVSLLSTLAHPSFTAPEAQIYPDETRGGRLRLVSTLTAKPLKGRRFQQSGIVDALLRLLDNAPRKQPHGSIFLVLQTKFTTGIRQSVAHGLDKFLLENLAFEKRPDRHAALPPAALRKWYFISKACAAPERSCAYSIGLGGVPPLDWTDGAACRGRDYLAAFRFTPLLSAMPESFLSAAFSSVSCC